MSKSPLSIDAVMAAMADYAEASAEERKARAEYAGYSWGYHGYNYIEAVNKAKERAQEALEDYIRRCVDIALAGRSKP